jgi:hypothetical protein
MNYLLTGIILISLNAFAEISSPTGVYGPDNRTEVYLSSTVHQKLAASTAAMIPKILMPGPTNTLVRLPPFSDDLMKKYGAPACLETRFTFQKSHSLCSGSLIAPDLILTAGHCIVETACADNNWVFNYYYGSNGMMNLKVEDKDVYSCKKIIAFGLNIKDEDYAIIQLDRKVEGRIPLDYRSSGKISTTDTLLTIGTPSGLPIKVTTDGKVRSNDPKNFFITTLDTFSGNSGSPVFNASTNAIEGILVRGDEDYVVDPVRECVVENKCAESACAGEDVSRILSVPIIATFMKMTELTVTGSLQDIIAIMPKDFWMEFPFPNGKTMLMVAVHFQQPEVVKYLLSRGANLKVKDRFGATLLHYFGIKKPNEEIFSQILKGNDLEAKTNLGETALLLAAKYKNFEAVKMLFKAGANSEAKDNDGNYATKFFADSPEKLYELRQLGMWDPTFVRPPSKYEILGKLYKDGTLPTVEKLAGRALKGRCFHPESPDTAEAATYIVLNADNKSYKATFLVQKEGPENYYDDKSLEDIYALYPDLYFELMEITPETVGVPGEGYYSSLKRMGSYLIEELYTDSNSRRCYYFLIDGLEPL